MANPDVWPTVHAERKALAADLDGLDAQAWDTPSLCRGWSVRDVIAHMTATSKLRGPRFFVKLAGSGFRLARLQAKDIAVERGSSPADTLARFEAQLDSTGAPPGPTDTMLGEVVVHAEDVRRPLGIAHTYPTDAVVRVADFYKGSNLVIGAKRRIAGLTLQATDTDWVTGRGPTVAGPMLSIVLAMTGRTAALDDLHGEGVDTLRSRS
jgi:uncharacterized protein (TIGR03083 family)